MKESFLPKDYKSVLNLYETQTAIGMIHTVFEKELSEELNLKRASAPLIVDPNTGLNDDLNGVERPVKFDIKFSGGEAVVVHSLAKWKRMALDRYGFKPGEGLFTDMNAIRRDEDLDNLHSVYVDQWDWEKVITKEQRNKDFLKETVKRIVRAIYDTQNELVKAFPSLTPSVKSLDVSFITSQELEDMFPSLTPKQREDAYIKDHPTTFIMQIGDKLKSGERHDGRAPDYDDWSLNGDILFYDEVLDMAIEISSMGIRVDSKSLDYQLNEANANDRRKYPFHKALLNNELPLTIGGGIGQSRLSMFLLGKAHIGEVQSSIWDQKTKDVFSEAGIVLL
jgi:aspartate--ammonia ligase